MPKRVSLDIDELIIMQTALTAEMMSLGDILKFCKDNDSSKETLDSDIKKVEKLRNKITNVIKNYWR